MLTSRNLSAFAPHNRTHRTHHPLIRLDKTSLQRNSIQTRKASASAQAISTKSEFAPIVVEQAPPASVDEPITGFDAEFANDMYAWYQRQSTTPIDFEHFLKQWRVEEWTTKDTIQRYDKVRDDLNDMNKGSCLKPVESIMQRWYDGSLVQMIKEEQDAIRKGVSITPHSKTYGNNLLLLEARQMAIIVMHTVLGLCLHHPDGVPFTIAAVDIGNSCQAEANVERLRSLMRRDRQLGSPTIVNRLSNRLDPENMWSLEAKTFVGGALINCLLINCPLMDENGVMSPGLVHDYVMKKGKNTGVLRMSDVMRERIQEGHDIVATANARNRPMLIPPVPWQSAMEGGYLHPNSQTAVMRTKGHALHLEELKHVPASQIEPIFDILNALSGTSWIINKPLYDVVVAIWNAGGGVASLPSRQDVPVPPEIEWDDEMSTDKEKSIEFYTKNNARKKAIQHNRDLHSLRCDTILKLSVAESVLNEVFYFPHNMDFRGRTYPIPPHLNHLGADISRGMLLFSEGRAYGENGLKWLKIHIANLYGKDKLSFEERTAFTEEHHDDIIESATNPVHGKGWWKSAENPWQVLSACFEYQKVINSPDHTKYVSHLPIHQDGTCNGLQHYAALGGDIAGAREVNLLPSDRPQDVYNGVAMLVAKRIEKDAEAGNEMALKLKGKIERKIIKQTVMTSVYGVTFVGAREQIENALKDRKTIDEESIWKASTYIARHTFNSLGEIFHGANSIMKWLSKCASVISRAGHTVKWVTPLGLPVVQPYRKRDNKREYVRTLVQTVCLYRDRDDLPVNARKQTTAFPPNYVHSLDSSHMMKACLGMKKANLTFASVHDSFWTHAGSVDDMNVIIRDTFVELHQEPLLEDLLKSFQLEYPDLKFPELPRKGELDVSMVKQSKYFFN
eukprot:TRINITY_DN1136_c0_g1_i1.p1 TRINITY_DN1136_c0_g1~~TRINITY_DN1136_c0_g1_i1.p1  ORF type:complete len:903 (-),score=209.58 TRINITY_DN1136_c0_g1_i1:34-2742(-)